MAWTYCWYDPWGTNQGPWTGIGYVQYGTWGAVEEAAADAAALGRKVRAVLAFLHLLSLFLARKARRPHWPRPASEAEHRRPTLRGTRVPRPPPATTYT